MSINKEIRPSRETETDQKQPGGVTSILQQNRRYPRKIQLSDTAEAVIADYAIDLMLDKLQLSQLPESLFEFYTFAYESGRHAGLDSRDGMDRLKFEADLWYFCYSNRKTPSEFYKHLTNEMWAGANS